MPKSLYSHLVYLNNAIDQKIWHLYAPFCAEIQSKGNTIKHHTLLCSNIELYGSFYLQVTAHFKSNQTINLKVPHSLILLIREVSSEDKIVIGFAPKVSQ